MEQINLKAMAKVNLGLDVVKRREDGYHEVRMIMQTIWMYDKILIRKIKEQEIRIQTNLFFLPVNENNLIYKAAKLLMDEFQIREGVSMRLDKFIPVAAGMAGGSSDAAAVLFGMNQLFQLGLSKKELMERGLKIGADVPYCIMRGTALAEGIGEILTELPPPPKCHVLIAKPGISVSTKFVYENLHVDQLKRHPDIDGLIHAMKNQDLYGMAGKMENVLETVTTREYPVIEELKNRMKKKGALNAMMSGSGPTVFGLFEEEEKAKDAYAELKQSNLAKQLYLTGFYHNPQNKGGKLK